MWIAANPISSTRRSEWLAQGKYRNPDTRVAFIHLSSANSIKISSHLWVLLQGILWKSCWSHAVIYLETRLESLSLALISPSVSSDSSLSSPGLHLALCVQKETSQTIPQHLNAKDWGLLLWETILGHSACWTNQLLAWRITASNPRILYNTLYQNIHVIYSQESTQDSRRSTLAERHMEEWPRKWQYVRSLYSYDLRAWWQVVHAEASRVAVVHNLPMVLPYCIILESAIYTHAQYTTSAAGRLGSAQCQDYLRLITSVLASENSHLF